MSYKLGYNHTLRACYIGYIIQAIVNNFAPLLFLTFVASFGLSLPQITLIITINFLVQLLVDLLSAVTIDRIGYRKSIVVAHVLSAAGLAGLAILPHTMSAYKGIMICVVLYAIGGGIIEVLISTIVDSCPTDGKAAAMSLLHSFYCWGHFTVIFLSALFFAVAGLRHWRMLSCLWELVTAANILYFCFVPIYTPSVSSAPSAPKKGQGTSFLRNSTFWLLFVLMICAGASEQRMSQRESALHGSESIGDICGSAAFALCMGTERSLYSKNAKRLSLHRALALSAALCVTCWRRHVLLCSPLQGMWAVLWDRAQWALCQCAQQKSNPRTHGGGGVPYPYAVGVYLIERGSMRLARLSADGKSKRHE